MIWAPFRAILHFHIHLLSEFTDREQYENEIEQWKKPTFISDKIWYLSKFVLFSLSSSCGYIIRCSLCIPFIFSFLFRLDYVSSSNEVDVIFHTDFSNTFTGYELLWRAADVTSCTSGKTIMAGFVGSPFPLGDQSIHTPNFPYFNLPQLDCVYHIVAPGLFFSHPIRGITCLPF